MSDKKIENYVLIAIPAEQLVKMYRALGKKGRLPF